MNSNSTKLSHQFFNISQNEAQAVDPQQRILLEVSYQALENGKSIQSLLSLSNAVIANHHMCSWLSQRDSRPIRDFCQRRHFCEG